MQKIFPQLLDGHWRCDPGESFEVVMIVVIVMMMVGVKKMMMVMVVIVMIPITVVRSSKLHLLTPTMFALHERLREFSNFVSQLNYLWMI